MAAGGDSWAPIPDGSGFTLAALPYGIAGRLGGRPRMVARIGDAVLAVGDVLGDDHDRSAFETDSLNAFLALGPQKWASVRGRITDHLTDPTNERPLDAIDDVELRLPVEIGDYVDFYSSIEHATNLGRLFRPGGEPLLPNWRHLPVGYHGRSGTVVVTGTPVRRPAGLMLDGDRVVRRPTEALDIEIEVGFVVGEGNPDGAPIAPDDAARHVFGAVLVNDWSARDIQAFEYQPLGPFLGKSFLTSISAWVVPLSALEPFLIAPPAQAPEPDVALRASQPWALDLDLAVELNGSTISQTSFRHLYWTFAQQLAHLTSNGSTTRAGDLFASGTVSGPGPTELGSLIELTQRGASPVTLADGRERSWLDDGDTVVLRGSCGQGADKVGFGEVVGTVVAATTKGQS